MTFSICLALPSTKDARDFRYDFGREKQSCLDGGNGKVRKKDLQLSGNHLDAYWLNSGHNSGNLCHETCYCRETINAEGAKGFQVRLDSSAATAIRTGDRQSDRGGSTSSPTGYLGWHDFDGCGIVVTN